MSLKEFVQANENQLRQSTPYLIYKGQSDYIKTRFGVSTLNPILRDSKKLGRKEAKSILKSTHLKLKTGQRFVYKRSDVINEVIPGYGIVAGNIAGKDWTIEDVEFLLEQDIEGIRWVNGENVLVFMKERRYD